MNAKTLLVSVALLCAVAAASSCGSDGDTSATSTEEPDGGGLLDDAGSLSGLEVLNPVCGAGAGGETDGCDECVINNCESHFSTCFGSDYANTLGGLCASFGECIMDCDCGDPDCFGVCTSDLEAAQSDPCLDCVRGLASCELQHCEVECQEDDTRDAGRNDVADAGAT